jgi:hypothetical protein
MLLKKCLNNDIEHIFERYKINVSYVQDRSGPSPENPYSFSYRAMRGEYCVYLWSEIKNPLRAILDTQEKGHILYNHFVRPDSCKKQFDEFFKKNMPIIFFRLPEQKNLNQYMGMYSTYIYERFIGMAQAMEVNSKLFGGEWPSVLAVINGAIPDYYVKKSNYASYPKPGWPLALDWMSYMVLLCRDMKNSLDSIGSGEGNTIRTGDILSYNSEKKHEKKIKENYDLEAPDYDEHIRRGRTTHVSSAAASHSVRECNELKELVMVLRERAFVEMRKRLNTDMLYNINRNKFQTDVLIPRRSRQIDKMPASLCILLDVSGSVPVALLQRVVKTIMRAEGVFDRRKSRLVYWSDSLRGDIPLSEIHHVIAGGSTVMADGIEYCKKYTDDNSSFFIISDFQDDIGDWIRAAKDIKGRKTAIAYDYLETKVCFERWFSIVGSNSNYKKEQVSLNDFSAVFDTVLLRDYERKQN